VRARTGAINELKALIVTADEARRGQLRGLRTAGQVAACAKCRDRTCGAVHERATRSAMRSLARRIQLLDTEVDEHDRALKHLPDQAAPQLIAERGIGYVTAAQFYIASSHPGRCHSEAAFAASAAPHPCPPPPARTRPGTASTEAATVNSTARVESKAEVQFCRGDGRRVPRSKRAERGCPQIGSGNRGRTRPLPRGSRAVSNVVRRRWCDPPRHDPTGAQHRGGDVAVGRPKRRPTRVVDVGQVGRGSGAGTKKPRPRSSITGSKISLASGQPCNRIRTGWVGSQPSVRAARFRLPASSSWSSSRSLVFQVGA
jgi:hypothetical protein